MKTHKYKVGKRVVIRHGACGAMMGAITKLTRYPVRKPGQIARATYTVRGDDGIIYPLLGIDKESTIGNICTKDTKLGHIIDYKSDYEDLERPRDDKYRIHTLAILKGICKKRSLKTSGRKADLIKRLVDWDDINP